MESIQTQDAAAPEWDDEARWRAVQERDERADGVFVYGVRSTMVFCRASCPSRRPRRDGTAFFASPEAAAQAGFRPCKRCRPERVQSMQVARVQETCRVIEASAGDALSLDDLSRQVGGSAGHLQRTFKQMTGVTPREYADALRLGQLKSKLQEGESVLGALYDAGYGSPRGVYERAPAQLGMTPATYRRGGKGARIRFGIAPCALGFLLAAATETGICSVSLGDAPDALEAALRTEFPAATVERDEAHLQAWMEALLPLLNGEEPHRDLPLDIRATAFQWRVWQALRAIGSGETRSYSDVAVAIGQPTAVRAVARACASNPVALIVPCHRVVREDGSPSGYRWGLQRKETLLARERERREA